MPCWQHSHTRLQCKVQQSKVSLLRPYIAVHFILLMSRFKGMQTLLGSQDLIVHPEALFI